MDNFDSKNALFLLIDVQEKLVSAMDEKIFEEKCKNMEILIKAANILNAPVAYTEQYTKGLGPTISRLKNILPSNARYFEKITFSCCGEKQFLDYVDDLQPSEVIIFGMETHVCVLQTALDFVEFGYKTNIVKDAVQSRTKDNWKTGLNYMSDHGAYIATTEIVLFSLLKKAKTEEFKKISALLK